MHGLVNLTVNLTVNLFIFNLLQVLFDYPLPFAALGLAGLFRPNLRGAVVGTVAGTLGRFVFHFVSGVGFALYVPKGWNPAHYAAVHNAL